MKHRLVSFVLITAASLSAQRATALVGATLVHTDGGGSVADGVVVIEGARIAAVGARADVQIPEDAVQVDVRGKWIIPGLIDAHVHFFQSGGLYTRPDIVDLRKVVPYEQELAAIESRLDDTFARYLCCGITAVADVGGPMWNFEVRERARGNRLAPRVAVAGPLISTYQPDALTTDDPPIVKVDDADAARALVRKQVERGTDLIKIWYIVRRGEDPEQHRALVAATVAESHAHGVRVAVHATQLETARIAVETGVDVLVHSVDDRPVDQAFVDLLLANHVVYTTTLVVGEGYGEVLSQQVQLLPVEHRLGNPDIVATLFDLRGLDAERLPRGVRQRIDAARPVRVGEVALANLARLAAAGVAIAAGTDAGNIGTLHGPSLFREFALMREAGLTPAQILTAATVGGARVLGRSDELGSLTAGKLADLVVLDADPLADIQATQRIWRVVKGGELLDPAAILTVPPAAVVQRHVNAYNARDLDAFVADYTEDVVIGPLRESGAELRDLAAAREQAAAVFAASPQLHCQVGQRIVRGAFVIDDEHVRGLMGAAEPVDAVTIYELRDGKIARVWFAR